jgi:hypothetical protein
MLSLVFNLICVNYMYIEIPFAYSPGPSGIDSKCNYNTHLQCLYFFRYRLHVPVLAGHVTDTDKQHTQ